MKHLSTIVLMGMIAIGCGSDEDTPNSPGGDTGCQGAIAGCALSSLDATQLNDACDLVLASIDDPAGTEYKCEHGPAEGLFLHVNSKAECVQAALPKGCPFTVSQLIACYKAAKDDPCAALANDGACSGAFSPACSGQ